MKPEQFIREFGVEKAGDLLDQREKFIHVEKPTHFDTDLEIFIHEADFRTGKLDESDIDLSDLKRLVESVDLVGEHYTVERAKIYADSPYTAPEVKQALERAIADYESIYGGGDE
ncbi:hypothetical protein [Acinetobacter baumannii]|uniref:hypothetical protein n=1 Tax=Acinetobacter baumannii TaxID=470 RepID=UPI0038928D6E